MNLDWKNIRSLNGGQDKAFEELCRQLARDTKPQGAKFVPNGTPDGGVECTVELPAGDEFGWQSKYVFTMDDSQWSQIDDSVKTALRTHPRLVRYYICLPINLPDARQGRKKSARDRWNTRQAKWNQWATQRQMQVEFILWDSSYLLDLLAQPKNSGRVMFWFGSPGCFDKAWFKEQINKAHKSAGPRYTPALHVELPIARHFDALGRTQAMVSQIRNTGRGLQEHFKWVSRWSDGDETPGLGTATQPLKSAVGELFDLLDTFAERPCGSQGLDQLIHVSTKALSCFGSIEKCLEIIQAGIDIRHDASGEEKRRQSGLIKRLEDKRHTLWEFESALREAKTTYSDEASFAETQLLVLSGEAGTGKTHLFCDLASQRLAQGRPTVLLLGQSFTTTEDPAQQVAVLLGLPNASLEEIVGCLEAAAQAANARCLILIDALNEGMGRQIWPAHLARFVESVTRSPWLALALSVRTCYLESVIAKEILASAAQTVHRGFGEVQYEAARTFFLYHDLEFASAPVFSEEFSNPLFLKTLCRGLKESGYKTLPRGFHGITKVFGLYVSAMDEVLAKRLDYAPKQRLVHNSLRAFAIAMAKEKCSWFLVEIGSVIINAHLPGREYSRSLYKALVDDGLLMESLSYLPDGTTCDVVSIAYERWADHLIAHELLNEHLDPSNPAAAFQLGGPLALFGESFSMPRGLVEALLIQLPERIGQELLSVAPYWLKEWGVADAFLKSVLWRAPEACTPDMVSLLDFIEHSDLPINGNVWDTRIAVATIPSHVLNMEHMDRHLRALSMPDRDANWSIAIHHAWDDGLSIHHLVEWAWALERGSPLDDDAIWLSTLSLCWCFTSSHRFLRDRATKAAVNLLDGRHDWTARMVRHFVGIDDLYVWERVLAVACGVALRSFDESGVGRLAEAVYETVFASGTPLAHILLRDYARGVIERAVHLGSKLSFDPEMADPPYPSVWPIIPSKEEIESLKTDWQEIGKTRPDEEWAKHDIFSSINDGDFGRYVIGTNSWATDWLSLRLDEPEWVSPQERIDALVESFDKRQRRTWMAMEKLNSNLLHHEHLISSIRNGKYTLDIPESKIEAAERDIKQRALLLTKLRQQLKESISGEQHAQLDKLIEERSKYGSNHPPRFDLRLIQRYVTKRVFDLGWTVERFGWFDRNYDRYHNHGRDAHKSERMGKKYQWIAYHEICALIADHFKYQENDWRSNPAKAYEGPWQDYFRDIDPTHGIKSLPISISSRHGKSPWWEPNPYNNWQNEVSGAEWALDASDFPDVSALLRVKDGGGVSWLHAFSAYVWERKRLPSESYDDAEKRKVWLRLQAFLVKNSDVTAVLQWVNTQADNDRWINWDLPHNTSLFLGEYGWSRASRYFDQPYYGNDGWKHPEGCPAEMLSIPVQYLEESSTFDCSMYESFRLTLPCDELIRGLELRWTGLGTDFVNKDGILLATDPSAHWHGDDCLLIREDAFCHYLASKGLTMVWVVRGDKECIGRGSSPREFHRLVFSGALALTPDGFTGKITHDIGKP